MYIFHQLGLYLLLVLAVTRGYKEGKENDIGKYIGELIEHVAVPINGHLMAGKDHLKNAYECFKSDNVKQCMKDLVRSHKSEKGITGKKKRRKKNCDTSLRKHIDYTILRQGKEIPRKDESKIHKYMLYIIQADSNKIKQLFKPEDLRRSQNIQAKILRMGNSDSDESYERPKRLKKDESSSEEYEVLIPKKYNIEYKKKHIENDKQPKILYMQSPSRLMTKRRKLLRSLLKEIQDMDNL